MTWFLLAVMCLAGVFFAGWLFPSGPLPHVDPVAVGHWFGFDWHEFLRMMDAAKS